MKNPRLESEIYIHSSLGATVLKLGGHVLLLHLGEDWNKKSSLTISGSRTFENRRGELVDLESVDSYCSCLCAGHR